MMSQRVERTWIRSGGYGRFRGEWVNRGIDFINFCLKQGIFSWTINSLRDSVDQAVNSFVIANGLNKKEF